MLVFDQVLKNNSFVTFTNTNVSREGKVADANVEKLQVQIGSKDNSYTFYGDISYSHLFENAKNETGFASFQMFEKSSGNFKFNIAQNIVSQKYNINDLGFLNKNNEVEQSGSVSYQIFKPRGKLRRASFDLNISRNMLYKPQVYSSTNINSGVRIHLTNFFSTGISINNVLQFITVGNENVDVNVHNQASCIPKISRNHNGN